MPLGFHIRLRARDDRVIATSDAERRKLARIFLRIGQDHGLLTFNAADTHSHAEVLCDRAAAGQFARRVESALTQALGVTCGFEPAYIGPIQDQRHLDRTFWYILDQQTHHGLANDPRREASNLPDLLGMRLIGQHTIPLVREHLPRTDRVRLLALLGQADLEPGPVPLGQLAEAAAAAAALPDLQGRRPETITVRAAATQVGLSAHSPAEVCAALNLPARTLRHLRHRPVSAALTHAVQLQLAHRATAPQS